MNQSSAGPFDAFPEEVQNDLEGLIVLGHLDTTVEWCGHSFGLRTLKAQEELQVYRIVKEYQESFGQVLCLAAATVALSLTHIDHFEDFCEKIGPSARAFADSRFAYVTENWYKPVIEHLFKEYELLRARQLACIEAMRDLSPRSRTDSPISPDSLSAAVDFPRPTEDIRELLTGSMPST
jgi:hypothetical protein